MRRVMIGVVGGFALLAAGALVFFGGSAWLPMWVSWVVGPLCWYAGFTMVVGTLVKSLFSTDDAETATEPQRVEEKISVPVAALPPRLGLANGRQSGR